MSEGKTDYWLGYAYDRLMQKRMAELYRKKGIAAVENSIEIEDVKVYASIVQRLTGLLNVWGEYEEAQKIVLPAIEQLEELDCDTTSDYANLLKVVLASARLRPANIWNKATGCTST